jgi:hypothetical protein
VTFTVAASLSLARVSASLVIAGAVRSAAGIGVGTGVAAGVATGVATSVLAGTTYAAATVS